MADLDKLSLGELYKKLSEIHDAERSAAAQGVSVNHWRTVQELFKEIRRRKNA